MPVDVQFAVAHDHFLEVDGSLVEGLDAPLDARSELSEEQFRGQIQAWAESVVAREWAGTCSSSDKASYRDPEVCIRIVDEAESQQLNAAYRGKDKPTNVLSFSAQLDAQFVEQTQLELLGDIVICAGVIAEEAREQSKSLLDHLAHMVIHGMLHLYGYDHETPVAAQQMELIEREILGGFGVNDPYQQI